MSELQRLEMMAARLSSECDRLRAENERLREHVAPFTAESFRDDVNEGRARLSLPGPTHFDFAKMMVVTVTTAEGGTRLFVHPMFEGHRDVLADSLDAVADDLMQTKANIHTATLTASHVERT